MTAKYSVHFCGHVDEKGPCFHEIQLCEGTMKCYCLLGGRPGLTVLALVPVASRR